MTVIGFLSVAPVREGSMAEDVAEAVASLEEFPVSYETTPMGTVIEADDIGNLLDAVEAAHRAVDADRVSTFLKIDHKRGVDQRPEEKVADVEAALGREATGKRDPNGNYTGR
jgi:uncharacterized protein (TIGR00106 family)